MMEKLIITAAICGAEVTKENSPAVPYTVEEMVREAKSAYDAGAAVIHVHVRWDDGTPTQDRERFRVVLEAIKAACPGVILIPSTGGATGMTPEERLQPTELFPEMATLDCGTCNFGDDIFVNDMPTMRAFGQRMIENRIKPEYECFEIGHLDPRHGGQPELLSQANPLRLHLDRHRHRPQRLGHGRRRNRNGRQRPRWL